VSRHKPLAVVVAVVTAAGVLSACSSSPKISNAGNAIYTTIDANNQITPGAPMNPFNASPNTFLGYDQMQLGFSKKNALDPNDFFPGLAKSWTVTPQAVTVQLQDGAKWSDGSPVTAADIRTSLAIAYTQGNAGVAASSFEISGVKDLGGGKVEIDQAPGVNNLQFAKLVLSQTVVADKVYGSLLPPDVWTTIAASQGADPTAAQAANDKLTALGKTVASFAPTADLSAGPFVITAINPGSAELARNQYFYDVKKISPAKVILKHYTGNEQVWGYMQSGQLDSAPYTSMPSNILSQVLGSGYTRDDSISYVDAAIAFNESVAPYDKTAVRQALSYVIDRQAATEVGEPVGGVANKYNTGLIDSSAGKWLSADQLAGLTQYDVDTAKATALLQSAGLKKDGSGHWLLPDGTPWKITLQTVNGFSDWIAASTVVAKELSDFGIPTTPAVTADFPTYQKEMAAGKYPVGWWLTALGPATSAAYARLYGKADGYTAAAGQATHSDTGTNWIHTPTTYTVGGAPVDPGQLTAQLSVLSLDAQKPVVAQLAQATNQEVPMLQIWDYTLVQFTNGKRFTNFPKTGDDALLSNPPGVWMMQGYVQAK
jgi:peptide/nickel transport system substrate-binding protein